MTKPATYSMISVLLVSLILYFVYVYNVRYDETKVIMEGRLQNLTTNYKKRRITVETLFQNRLKHLHNQLESLMSEQHYEIENLQTTYEREKYLMNSTFYILYAMHFPEDLIPGEMVVNPQNFLRTTFKTGIPKK